jgi:hypothetical protein
VTPALVASLAELTPRRFISVLRRWPIRFAAVAAWGIFLNQRVYSFGIINSD